MEKTKIKGKIDNEFCSLVTYISTTIMKMKWHNPPTQKSLVVESCLLCFALEIIYWNQFWSRARLTLIACDWRCDIVLSFLLNRFVYVFLSVHKKQLNGWHRKNVVQKRDVKKTSNEIKLWANEPFAAYPRVNSYRCRWYNYCSFGSSKTMPTRPSMCSICVVVCSTQVNSVLTTTWLQQNSCSSFAGEYSPPLTTLRHPFRK